MDVIEECAEVAVLRRNKRTLVDVLRCEPHSVLANEIDAGEDVAQWFLPTATKQGIWRVKFHAAVALATGDLNIAVTEWHFLRSLHIL